MRHGSFTLILPNNLEYSGPQLKMLIKQIEMALNKKISLGAWNKL
jgi:hypothetical protein